MTAGQNAPVSFHCPRCGGLMSKPAGSSFYWHATNNHPPCSITSIVELPRNISTDDSSAEKSGEPLEAERANS
jgi:hypothetical protein